MERTTGAADQIMLMQSLYSNLSVFESLSGSHGIVFVCFGSKKKKKEKNRSGLGCVFDCFFVFTSSQAFVRGALDGATAYEQGNPLPHSLVSIRICALVWMSDAPQRPFSARFAGSLFFVATSRYLLPSLSVCLSLRRVFAVFYSFFVLMLTYHTCLSVLCLPVL